MDFEWCNLQTTLCVSACVCVFLYAWIPSMSTMHMISPISGTVGSIGIESAEIATGNLSTFPLLYFFLSPPLSFLTPYQLEGGTGPLVLGMEHTIWARFKTRFGSELEWISALFKSILILCEGRSDARLTISDWDVGRSDSFLACLAMWAVSSKSWTDFPKFAHLCTATLTALSLAAFGFWHWNLALIK